MDSTGACGIVRRKGFFFPQIDLSYILSNKREEQGFCLLVSGVSKQHMWFSGRAGSVDLGPGGSEQSHTIPTLLLRPRVHITLLSSIPGPGSYCPSVSPTDREPLHKAGITVTVHPKHTATRNDEFLN